jgi:ribosomal protein S18 acetylase RimI-like enzyme
MFSADQRHQPDFRGMIRSFRHADLQAVAALWHETKRQAFPYVAIQQRYTLASDSEYFRHTLLTECSILVAELNQEPVGFMALKPGYIDQLFVRVDRQRRGIGSALLNHAKQLTLQDLRLYTYQKNYPARTFYERHGFRAIAFGVSPAPENEPDVEYQWSCLQEVDSPETGKNIHHGKSF